MSVTSLAEARARREPHAEGTARCASCAHEWAFLSPVPVPQALECPDCHLMTGQRLGLYAPPEHSHAWTCDCGNNRWLLLEDWILCEQCGHTTSYPG